MWDFSPWVFAGPMRGMQVRTFSGVQLQTSWILPQLRSPADVRDRDPLGGLGVARATDSSMGAEFPIPDQTVFGSEAKDYGSSS